MATLIRSLAVISTILAAVLMAGYAALMVWDRTHQPELPLQMRAEVWNGGARSAAGSKPGARHALAPYSKPSMRLK